MNQKEPIWKQKFDKRFDVISDSNFILEPDPKPIKDFISTEIIEKLIEEIPDYEDKDEAIDGRLLKQQLKGKWLGKEKE